MAVHVRIGSIAAVVATIAVACPVIACRGGSAAPGDGTPSANAPAAPQTLPPAPAPPSEGPRTVEVVRVIEQPLGVELVLPGELAPNQSVDIHARVAGFVRAIHVDRGSRVRAGDLLGELDAPELAAARAEAQSRVQAAEAQLGVVRARALVDAGTFDKLKAASATPGVVAGNDLLVAEKTLEASRGQVAVAEQNVESTRQALNAVREQEGYLRVTAPFAGTVTERRVHPGALVGPGAQTPMLRLVDGARLRLVVPVPEPYIARIPHGTAIAFTVAAYPGQRFRGTVARVASTVDVATRTMAVELDVTNGDGRLIPGTFAQVQWPVSRPGPSLFVPSASIASTTDRTFVIRVRGGRTEWVDVRTGLTSGALVEVFGELRAGDEIVGRGSDELRPGMDVQARPAGPAA